MKVCCTHLHPSGNELRACLGPIKGMIERSPAKSSRRNASSQATDNGHE